MLVDITGSRLINSLKNYKLHYAAGTTKLAEARPCLLSNHKIKRRQKLKINSIQNAAQTQTNVTKNMEPRLSDNLLPRLSAKDNMMTMSSAISV